MASRKPALAKLLRGLSLTVAMSVLLPVLLLAALLVLVAPLPQLAIHAHWCYWQLGPLGGAILLLGALGAAAVVVGLVRRRAGLHRAGMLLVVGPVVGVALHRAAATDDWQDIPLLGAFLFSGLLAYLAAAEGI